MNDPFRFISQRIRRAIFAVAVGCITFVSLWPHEQLEMYVPEEVQAKDFLIHLTCYFVLEACCLWAMARRSAPLRSRVFSALFCFLYGVLMELLQTLPAIGRSASFSDARQNGIGALLAAVLIPTFLWPPERPRPPHP